MTKKNIKKQLKTHKKTVKRLCKHNIKLQRNLTNGERLWTCETYLQFINTNLSLLEYEVKYVEQYEKQLIEYKPTSLLDRLGLI